MTDVSQPIAPAPSVTERRKARLVAIGAAAVAALVVWAIIEFVAGVDLTGPGMGDQAPLDVQAVHVIVATVVASLAGWGVLALLERFTDRARTLWIGLASAGTVLSLGGPLTGAGVTGGDRVGLTVLHLTVAAVLIPLYARTTR